MGITLIHINTLNKKLKIKSLLSDAFSRCCIQSEIFELNNSNKSNDTNNIFAKTETKQQWAATNIYHLLHFRDLIKKFHRTNGFVSYANAPNWNEAVYVCVCRNSIFPSRTQADSHRDEIVFSFHKFCYALMRTDEFCVQWDLLESNLTWKVKTSLCVS